MLEFGKNYETEVQPDGFSGKEGARPINLSLVPETFIVDGGTDSYKVPSNLHTHTVNKI